MMLSREESSRDEIGKWLCVIVSTMNTCILSQLNCFYLRLCRLQTFGGKLTY